MFGYVVPDKENLLVKDLELYKATYCGLCSVIKKEVSPLLPFSLSYDFVFLSMVRALITKDKKTVIKGRCKYNPLKKTNFAVSSESSLFTAKASLLLTYLKLEDDFADGDLPFYKKFVLYPFKKHLEKRVKRITVKEPDFKLLYDKVEGLVFELSRLEREECDDVDVLSEIFGKLLSEIASFGLSDSERLIALEIGDAIGRYIYIVDAIDDLEKDRRSGAFNPLLKKYGSLEKALENISSLDVAVGMLAKRALAALYLTNDGEYARIIENTITKGLGKKAYEIMTKIGEKND